MNVTDAAVAGLQPRVQPEQDSRAETAKVSAMLDPEACVNRAVSVESW